MMISKSACRKGTVPTFHFAVKKSLVADFEEVTDPELAAKWNVGTVPFRHADFEIIMQPGSAG